MKILAKLTGTIKNAAVGVVLVFVCLGLTALDGYAEEAKIDPKSFDTTEALIELLKTKGVLNDEEAQNFINRHKEQTQTTRQVITILPQEDQEEYIRNVSKGVTEKVTQDLNDLKENYEFRSDDLIKRSIVLEREVKRLEEIIMEEQKPQLQKSSWAQRIRFGGDIRLRHESVLFDKENATDIVNPNNPGTLASPNYINSTSDVHRQRIRLRVGMKAKLIDPSDKNVGKVTAGVRLATGSVGNPVSTNHTLGDDNDSKSDFVLDRAYLTWAWKPREEIWGNKIPEISLTGGVMKIPWFSTSLLWDSDLAFEGLAINFKTDTNEYNTMSGFLTAGYFPLEESSWTQKDKFLLGTQIGFKHRPKYGWEYKLAAAYYDYSNVDGEPEFGFNVDQTELNQKLNRMAPKYKQLGNSLFDMNQTTGTSAGETYGLLSDFKLLNLTGRLDNSLFYPIHVSFYWDWVKNLGYDTEEMAAKDTSLTQAQIEDDSGDTGYQIGLKVGYPKPRERWDWNVSLEYRYLESDAVLDAFTDSDFHLGGTNARGFILGGELGVYENIWVSARWMSANEIDDLQPIGGNTKVDDLSVDTFQFNINAEF